MLSRLALSVEMNIFEVCSGLLFPHLQNKWSYPTDYLFNTPFFFSNKHHFHSVDHLPPCSSKEIIPNSSSQRWWRSLSILHGNSISLAGDPTAIKNMPLEGTWPEVTSSWKRKVIKECLHSFLWTTWSWPLQPSCGQSAQGLNAFSSQKQISEKLRHCLGSSRHSNPHIRWKVPLCKLLGSRNILILWQTIHKHSQL